MPPAPHPVGEGGSVPVVFESLAGSEFGPAPFRTCRELVSEFVAATGDDLRHGEAAPPSLAGAMLFVVAPLLVADARLAGCSVVHGEQSFVWRRAIPLETDLSVRGVVTRVRERAGVGYVEFRLTVTGADGPVLEGDSLFLVAASGAATEVPEEEEPAPGARGPFEAAEPVPLPGPGEPVPPLARSASRADLIRYAGASRDWNPIHWDHGAARAAGLRGVVCHGLLQSAWLCQAATRHLPDPTRLSAARFRYRAPLRPGEAATITGSVREAGRIDLVLSTGRPVTTASFEIGG